MAKPYEAFTVEELIAEATRETAMRREVYERLCMAGKMRRADADRKIALMDAIARRLTRTAAV